MANLYNVPLENGVQLTLQNALLAGVTSTITFTASVTSKLQASASIPGILVIDRVDANGNETPTKTEYISFTGVTGSTVTGLTRGLASSTNQDHAAGAIVEFVPDVVWADSINDVITTQHNADGTHKTLSLISLASVTINNANINTPLITGGSAISLAINYSKLQNIEIDGSSQYNSSIFSASLASVTIQNFTTGANVQKLSYISTASTTVNLDLSTGNVFDVPLTGNKTINFTNSISNASLAQFFIVRLYYTGAYSATWGNTIRWPYNIAPTQTSTAGRADEFGFKALTTSIFEGFIVGQNYYD